MNNKKFVFKPCKCGSNKLPMKKSYLGRRDKYKIYYKCFDCRCMSKESTNIFRARRNWNKLQEAK